MVLHSTHMCCVMQDDESEGVVPSCAVCGCSCMRVVKGCVSIPSCGFGEETWVMSTWQGKGTSDFVTHL